MDKRVLEDTMFFAGAFTGIMLTANHIDGLKRKTKCLPSRLSVGCRFLFSIAVGGAAGILVGKLLAN